jgi:hypothetical protein
MERAKRLLNTYLVQRGLFARVAKKLGIDPSYVSRVAHGQRQSKRISVAIQAELNRIPR